MTRLEASQLVDDYCMEPRRVRVVVGEFLVESRPNDDYVEGLSHSLVAKYRDRPNLRSQA